MTSEGSWIERRSINAIIAAESSGEVWAEAGRLERALSKIGRNSLEVQHV
jgi:hypothetical protein